MYKDLVDMAAERAGISLDVFMDADKIVDSPEAASLPKALAMVLALHFILIRRFKRRWRSSGKLPIRRNRRFSLDGVRIMC